MRLTDKPNEFTTRVAPHGPGYYVDNPEGRTVAWVFERGYPIECRDKERAHYLCECLNKATKAQGGVL